MSNVGPNLVHNCSKLLPNGSLEPPGGPGVPRLISKRFMGISGLPFWLQKLSKSEPEFVRKPSTWFERHFGLSGCFPGAFFGRFGGHFGVLFRSPARKLDFVKNMLPPTWEHDFQGSGGVGKAQKTCPEAVCDRRRAPRASWGPLGFDLGPILGSFWDPKSLEKPPENKLEVEVAF